MSLIEFDPDEEEKEEEGAEETNEGEVEIDAGAPWGDAG